MDVLHHLVELGVHFLGGPHQALGVLGHLQGGHAHAAGVDGLGGGHDHVLLLAQEVQGVVGGGHIGHLDIVLDAGGGNLLGGLHAHVVLHGGGHVHVHVLHAPALGAGHELAAELIGIGLAVHGILGAHLQDEVQLLRGDDAVGIVNIAVGAGEVGDLGTQLGGLLHDAPAHVAVAGDGDALAIDGVMLVLEHLLEVVDGAVAGGLGADQGAAVAQALAGEDAVLPHALEAAVLAVQVTDFTAAHAHVAGGNVDIRADIAIEGRHEALAEAHDLGVGLAGGVEVGAALGTADGQAGEAVLEGLLEAQELDDTFIHVLLEAQAALIGADSAVELAAPTTVGMPLAVVVAPHHPEGEHTLGLHHAAQQVYLLILGMLVDDGLQRGEHLFHSLHEFGLVAVLGLDIFQHACQISIHRKLPPKFNYYDRNTIVAFHHAHDNTNFSIPQGTLS